MKVLLLFVVHLVFTVTKGEMKSLLPMRLLFVTVGASTNGDKYMSSSVCKTIDTAFTSLLLKVTFDMVWYRRRHRIPHHIRSLHGNIHHTYSRGDASTNSAHSIVTMPFCYDISAIGIRYASICPRSFLIEYAAQDSRHHPSHAPHLQNQNDAMVEG